MRIIGRLNLIVFFALIVILMILVKVYIDRRNELSIAKKALEYDSIVAAHIDLAGRMNDYRSLKRFFYKPYAVQIQEYAADFSAATRMLERSIPGEEVDEIEYFQKKISVADSVQSRLWTSQQNMLRLIEAYLATDDSVQSDFSIRRKEEATEKLQAFTSRLDASPVGTVQSSLYSIVFADSVYHLNVIATKTSTGISGNHYFKLAQNYLRLLDYSLESPRKQQVLHELQKMKGMFPRKGIVMIENIEHNLSSVTPADLRSIYKYLAMLKASLDSRFLDFVLGRIH